MRQIINYFIIFSVFTILLFCGKTTKQNTVNDSKNVKKKVAPKIHNNLILTIDDSKYYENDFKKFLHLHFKSFSNLKRRDTIYSYMLEKFIIQKMILHKAEIDNFKFDSELILKSVEARMNDALAKNKDELLNTEKAKTYIATLLYSKIKIKNREVKSYYAKHRNKYKKRAEVLLYEIMLNNKKKANEIRGILNTMPKRFSEIAKKESVSKISKDDGSLGYIEVDSLPVSFKRFITSTPLNKITPVIELLYGEINGVKKYTYHIFKVVKKKRARVLFYSKVKESIKKELRTQKEMKMYKTFIDKLSNTFKINVITKNLFFTYIKK